MRNETVPQLDSKSFDKNYKVLKDTAEWLSKQEEPDIDQLVPRIERAMQAYRIFKERLSAVEQTLGQYLGEGSERDEASDGLRSDGRAERRMASPDGDGRADGVDGARY